MNTPVRRRSTAIAATLVVALAACGGGKTAAPSIATTSTVAAPSTSTSVRPQAALSDVFGATLPPGYAFVEAPASIRSGIQQQALSADAATVVRAADIKIIASNGKTVGYTTAFLLQPGLSDANRYAIVQGYASSKAGSSLSTTTVGGKTVTLIRWSSTSQLAYAASSSNFVVVVVMQTTAQLDVVTPAVIASV